MSAGAACICNARPTSTSRPPPSSPPIPALTSMLCVHSKDSVRFGKPTMWPVPGITQFQTGLPCSIAEAKDYAGVGLDSNFGCGNNGQFWVVNGKPKIVGTFGPNGQWFTTTNPDGSPIFTPPTAGSFNTQRVRNL